MKSGKKKENGKSESKGKNRRSVHRYPALQPELNLRTRADLLDYDYLDKLGPEELDFLNRFTEEEIHANFNHSGEALNTEKKEKRACYSRNNSRNRDIMTLSRTKGWLTMGDTKDKIEERQYVLSPDSAEEIILDLIDAKDAVLRKKARS